MEDKSNHMLTIAMISIVFLFFAIIDPILVFAGKGNLKDIEDSVIVGKEKLAMIHDELERAAGKKEYNGVYLGDDGYLIERTAVDRFSREECSIKIRLLKQLTDKFGAHVMLVPSKACILKEKLPTMADCFDEISFLKRVRDVVGEESYIDVYGALNNHRDEEIFYRTDSHWTTLGAYYGYERWRNETQFYRYFYDPADLKSVKDDYLGPLSEKVPFAMTADQIKIFPKTLQKEVTITFDFWNQRTGFYDDSYLNSEDPYGYFLGDHLGFAEINTGNVRRKSLFILRDSTADCMIPLLTPYYDTIYILDVKYYKGDLIQFMEKYVGEKDEVMILYDCLNFLEEFEYD